MVLKFNYLFFFRSPHTKTTTSANLRKFWNRIDRQSWMIPSLGNISKIFWEISGPRFWSSWSGRTQGSRLALYRESWMSIPVKSRHSWCLASWTKSSRVALIRLEKREPTQTNLLPFSLSPGQFCVGARPQTRGNRKVLGPRQMDWPIITPSKVHCKQDDLKSEALLLKTRLFHHLIEI